jgi:hypothetical protein
VKGREEEEKGEKANQKELKKDRGMKTHVERLREITIENVIDRKRERAKY